MIRVVLDDLSPVPFIDNFDNHERSLESCLGLVGELCLLTLLLVALEQSFELDCASNVCTE